MKMYIKLLEITFNQIKIENIKADLTIFWAVLFKQM